MRRTGIAGLALASLSLPCGAGLPSALGDLSPLQPSLDYHSFANVEQFRVSRLELDLRVDSPAKVLRGVVGLHIKRLDPQATDLVLDTRDLDVSQVTQKAQEVLGAESKTETTWVNRPFHFGKKDPILGRPLVIELPPSNRPTEFIRIEYETSPIAPALQWLTAKQTTGKRKPFMYTQSEPIGTRSWIPLQDTPQIRVTYKALIHTDADVVALMSAKNDPRAKRNGEYAFAMSEEVPPYLIALAVGDLAYKATGPRSGVYAEKVLLEAASREFSGTESMLAAGEKLFGPYRWDRFDILVMPPSFPVGGMENPRLAFVTPTIIAGDRSLVSVIAQEIAHSWSGNLVTQSTWRDLWLTEGLTAYLQSRITEAVDGERQSAMERTLGLRTLRGELARIRPEQQTLAVDLRGRDPGEVLNAIACEKGRLFFTYLDGKFGRARFDAFLRSYFEHFEFQSVTTQQFETYLQTQLLERFPGVVSPAQVRTWIYTPGIPADALLPASEAFATVDAERTMWLEGRPAKTLDTRSWAAQQWIYFLDAMPAALTAAQCKDLDTTFGFTRTTNSEIARSWFTLAIRNLYQPAYARLEDYLQTIGRRRLIVPLYEEMMKTPAGAAQAKRVYALARPGYQSQTVAALDAIVKPQADKGDSLDD